MSNAAIRRFVAFMATSYIVIAMIGAIGAWLFLAVPKSAQKATACWPKRSRSRKS